VVGRFAIVATLALSACSGLKPDEGGPGADDANTGDVTDSTDATHATDASDASMTALDGDVRAGDPSGDAARDASADWSAFDAADRGVDGDARIDVSADSNSSIDRRNDEPLLPPSDGGSSDVGAILDGSGDNTRPCVPDCPTLGEFRCGTAAADGGLPRQIKVCSAAQGCLKWLDSATCPAGEACCEGSCKSAAQAAVCYAPAGFDYYVDVVHGVDDVDAGSPVGGTREQPFRTISRAIREATEHPRPGRRIYAGAGTYNEASGETFPLVLRNGVSLYGAGAGATTIRGSGPYDAITGGSANWRGTYRVTVVAGDDAANATLADVTLLSETPSPQGGYFGIYCDRGSAPDDNATIGVTSVENVVIGPGYQLGVTVMTSARPVASGCNFRMKGSVITGTHYGVVAQGCVDRENQIVDWMPVTIRIGTEEKGNRFSWLGSPYGGECGVLVNRCVANGRITNNLFEDSPDGIRFEQIPAGAGHGRHLTIVEKNVFRDLFHTGITIWGDESLVDLYDNEFTNITKETMGVPNAAIAVWAHGEDWVNYIGLRKARRNRFVGNDFAVLITSRDAVSFNAQGHVDFGSVEDPGENVLRCNSTFGGLGGDVKVALDVGGSGSMLFAGNVWDHFPPAERPVEGVLNGTDIIQASSLPWPVIDTRGGRADDTPCTGGRSAGPPTVVDAGSDVVDAASDVVDAHSD
jgi:hypothetical protein